jgi:hypothetical protein
MNAARLATKRSQIDSGQVLVIDPGNGPEKICRLGVRFNGLFIWAFPA